MPSAAPSRITGVRPLWGVEGGWLTISGDGFTVEPLPDVRIGGVPARVVAGSGRELKVCVPPGLDGGSTPVRLESAPGESALVEIGVPLATGLHLVDSPVFDREGNLFVTFSGSRGQQSPVSIYIVRPDGSREPFVTNLPNPTSLALDARGRLHVSSRFDGSVYLVGADGSAEVVATDLGVACGIAFDGDVLFVGDRTGSILRIEDGRVTTFASVPRALRRSISPSVRTARCLSRVPRSARGTAFTVSRAAATWRCSTRVSGGRRGWPSTRLDGST